LDLINENNKKMIEIYNELKDQEEHFIPFPNLIEQVDKVLEIQPDEISF